MCGHSGPFHRLRDTRDCTHGKLMDRGCPLKVESLEKGDRTGQPANRRAANINHTNGLRAEWPRFSPAVPRPPSAPCADSPMHATLARSLIATAASATATVRWSELLSGSYDCVDRIVLNAYFGMGHSPGGFRVWRRALTGSDDTLDNAHLMRLAGRFSRRCGLRQSARHSGHRLCGRGA
jgi:hypothetical protein